MFLQQKLDIDFCGLTFENPFVLAPSPSTDDLDMARRGLEAGWAGAILKTTSVESQPVPLAYPMISALRLEDKRIVALGNIDLISEHHIDEVEKRVEILKKEFPQKVIAASIMGASKEDWQELVIRLEAANVDLIECSFSCPQGTLGEESGAMLGQNVELSGIVAGWVKEAAKRVPVVIKLTDYGVDITKVARAVVNAGADGLCAMNTMPSLPGIDIDKFVPFPNVVGKSTFSGLSGPAIKPITLRCIAQLAKAVNVSITATGGISTWRDSVEMLLVGARTVQICTAVMHFGFGIINDLKDGLSNYLQSHGFESVESVVGLALPNIVTHDELPRPGNIVFRIRPELCLSDDLCYVACRDGGHMAIELDQNRLPKIDTDKCVGCGLCQQVCPVDECIITSERY